MGYDTKFKGVLKFTSEATGPQLAMLAKILGEDTREHPEWQRLTPDGQALTYVDLILAEDYSGLQWDYSTEKTYNLPDIVNLVIAYMHTKYPQFGLEGQLAAQGEELDDRWALVMVDGVATQQEVAIVGKIVICPHCEEKFMLEDAAQVKEPTRRRR